MAKKKVGRGKWLGQKKDNEELRLPILSRCKYAEVLAATDLVKDRGLGVVNPVDLPIQKLGYVRYGGNEVANALKDGLPHFVAYIEGRPHLSYMKRKKEGLPLFPHQCEKRMVDLYEMRTLEEMLDVLRIQDYEKYLVSPRWYFSELRQGRARHTPRFYVSIATCSWHPDSENRKEVTVIDWISNEEFKEGGWDNLRPYKTASKDESVTREEAEREGRIRDYNDFRYDT